MPGDISKLQKTLNSLQAQLQGLNYQTTLSATLLALTDSQITAEEVLKLAFTDVAPKTGETKHVSASNMMADIRKCLTHMGDAGHGPEAGAVVKAEPFIHHVEIGIVSLVNLMSAEVFAFSGENLPGAESHWGYTYIILDRRQKSGLVLTGKAAA